jgi:hypothetical protein
LLKAIRTMLQIFLLSPIRRLPSTRLNRQTLQWSVSKDDFVRRLYPSVSRSGTRINSFMVSLIAQGQSRTTEQTGTANRREIYILKTTSFSLI